MKDRFSKPTKISRGDVIAIVSPSSAIQPGFMTRWSRAIKYLQRELELDVRIMSNALANDGSAIAAGTAEQRAQDIMDAFADDDVKAIIATTGGYVANEILSHLDYEVIARNPKVLAGFSDVSALLLAISGKTGLTTFYGATLMSAFGDFEPASETIQQFKRALFTTTPLGRVLTFDRISRNGPWWGTAEDEDPLKYDTSDVPVPSCAYPGEAEGYSLPANFETLCGLGNSYFPYDLFDDAVLILEDTGANVGMIRRQFATLENHGVLERVRGVVFGSPDNGLNGGMQDFISYLTGLGEALKIPVIYDAHFGHIRPFSVVPSGVRTRIVSAPLPGASTIEILEAGVI